MVFKPFCGQFGCVLGVICLQKMMSLGGSPEYSMLGSKQSFKMDTLITTHPSFNISRNCHTIPPHTTPHLHISSSPNLSVTLTSLSFSGFPALLHTYSCPSDPILLIIVSSDQMTL